MRSTAAPLMAVTQVVTTTDRRGAEVFAVDLGEALARAGRSVRTVALHPGSAGGLAVPALGRTPLGPGTLRALHAEARRSALVVAHGSGTLAACALVAGRPGFVYRSIGDPAYWIGTRARRARVGVFLRRASAVVALWPGAAAHLARLHGLPPERVHVIPNGVPAERFRPAGDGERAAARAQLLAGFDGPVVAYLGALSAEKRVEDALGALAWLPGARLVIAGAGPLRADLEARAAALAPGRVEFLGSTAAPGLVLAAADALVLPSASEGMPAVLIEAGLSGVPVVATDVGGVREIVVPGETGFLVPPGQPERLAGALRAALAAPPSVGRAAREHCGRFDIGTVAAAWAELMDRVMHEPGGRSRFSLATRRRRESPSRP